MGDTYRTWFLDGLIIDQIGLITGSSAYQQFPNLPGYIFRLKAQSANIGSFFIGTNTGTSLPFEIDADDDTGWFRTHNFDESGISNLNTLFYRNPSGTSDYLAYWLQR